MQKERQSRPGTSLFRGIFRFLLALATAFGSLYLGVLALTLLMRRKTAHDRMHLFSKRINTIARKYAGTRVGSLYFNMAALKHIGRKSGRAYVTPVTPFPFGDGFVITLTYGPNSDWCRNVMASGQCMLVWKGQEYMLDKPEVLPISEVWGAYPLWTRPFAKAA